VCGLYRDHNAGGNLRRWSKPNAYCNTDSHIHADSDRDVCTNGHSNGDGNANRNGASSNADAYGHGPAEAYPDAEAASDAAASSVAAGLIRTLKGGSSRQKLASSPPDGDPPLPTTILFFPRVEESPRRPFDVCSLS